MRAKRRAQREADDRARYTPRTGDSRLETLRKIDLNGEGLGDLLSSSATDGQTALVWQLPTRYPTPGQVWVMPTMQIKWQQKQPKVVEELNELINADKVQPLVAAVARYSAPAATPNGPILSLEWMGGGPVAEVTQVEASQYQFGHPQPGDWPLRLNP